MEDGRIAGVVSRSHILSVVKNVQDGRTPVESIMTTDARTVGGKDRVVRRYDHEEPGHPDNARGGRPGIMGIVDSDTQYNWGRRGGRPSARAGNAIPPTCWESVMIEEPVTSRRGPRWARPLIMLDRRIPTLPSWTIGSCRVVDADLVELVASFRRRT